MSTYTHRYIEVKIECIDGQVWNKEQLPDPKKHEGEVWKIGNHNRTSDVAPYYMAKEGPGITFDDSVYTWEPVYEVKTKWVPLKWYGYLPNNRVFANSDPYYKPKYITAKDENGKEILLEENILWCNNGGYVRDEYVSSRGFSDSKLPQQMGRI